MSTKDLNYEQNYSQDLRNKIVHARFMRKIASRFVGKNIQNKICEHKIQLDEINE
jgi:hypothetical protein